METKAINLKLVIEEFVTSVKDIECIYLFGSRAYQTASVRSDFDILVKPVGQTHIKSSTLRSFAGREYSFLDFFLVEGIKAISCMNDSYVISSSFEELLEKLSAVELWNIQDGFRTDSFDWVFDVVKGASFDYTNLQDGGREKHEELWKSVITRAENEGLSVLPYFGDTIEKASAFITDILKRMVIRKEDLGQNGAAKNGWTVNLSSEYDCQNLFYSVTKPWVPNIGRENLTVMYDEQKKSADFDLFEGKLIIEMKFINDQNKKREVVKTLDGLSRFYMRNPGMKVLLFVIFVKEGVELDDRKWEADFTFYATVPRVITQVIRVP